MQGSNSPLVPKSEPYYVPPERAHIIAGDVAMPHQGPAHLIGQGRTAPAAAGRPPLRAPGREGPRVWEGMGGGFPPSHGREIFQNLCLKLAFSCTLDTIIRGSLCTGIDQFPTLFLLSFFS